MNYGLAELEIVDRINTFLSSPEINQSDKFEASLMPETEDQFKSFYSNYNKSKIAVQYIDSTYGPPQATGIVVQSEKARFRLIYEGKKLRGQGGIYDLIELSKLALLGFRLSSSDSITIHKFGLQEFEQNGWQHFLEIECETMNAQLHDDNSDPSLGGGFKFLKQRNFNDKEFTNEFQETEFNS